MISILISTYNYDCTGLVMDLRKLGDECGREYEILVGDDGSDDTGIRDSLQRLTSLPHCRVIRHSANHGQATMRNHLADEAKYDWLLFIDSDAAIRDHFFLKRYIDGVGTADVIVGGLLHPERMPDDSCSLRFSYEKKADKHRSAAERSMRPYNEFTAFNMMMSRWVFHQIRFCEGCKDYGYEDVLFGLELRKKGIDVSHIDNPLTHMGLDSNEVFLRKTETALRTLKSIEGKIGDYSRVKNMADRIKAWHLCGIVKSVHKVVGPAMRRNLLGRHPSLLVFSLYKLNYYIGI